MEKKNKEITWGSMREPSRIGSLTFFILREEEKEMGWKRYQKQRKDREQESLPQVLFSFLKINNTS